MDEEYRFWSKVQIGAPGECWTWIAGRNGYGYGNFRAATETGGRMVGAHRYAFESFNGPITQGMVLDHLCRVRHCVNPSHLEVVSSSVNTHRGITGQFGYQSSEVCKNGHPWAENLRFASNPKIAAGRQPYCAQCHRERSRGRVRSDRQKLARAAADRLRSGQPAGGQ